MYLYFIEFFFIRHRYRGLLLCPPLLYVIYIERQKESDCSARLGWSKRKQRREERLREEREEYGWVETGREMRCRNRTNKKHFNFVFIGLERDCIKGGSAVSRTASQEQAEHTDKVVSAKGKDVKECCMCGRRPECVQKC